MQTPINRHQKSQSAMEQRSVFMHNAKIIGQNLSQTYFKLEQLTLRSSIIFSIFSCIIFLVFSR